MTGKWITGFLVYCVLFPVLLTAQTSADALFESAKKKNLAGDASGALIELNQLLKNHPKYEEAWYERGRIHHQQKKYLEAINDFTKTIELNPKHHRALYLRGYTKFLIENYKGAIDDFNLATEIHQNSALAYWYRAEAKLKTGDKNGACEDWDKAYRLGYFEAASRIKNNCADMKPSAEVAADRHIRNGDRLLDKGDAAGALQEYLKAKELLPNSGNVYYSIGLAKNFLRDMKSACENWMKAAELGSPEAKQMLLQHCN